MTTEQPDVTNKRAHPRTPVAAFGWIALPGSDQLHRCAVRDISLSGVRLANIDPSALENGFSFTLEENGQGLRECRMVWHHANLVGAEFLPA